MKRSKILLAAVIIGVLMLIFSWSYISDTFGSLASETESAALIGKSIGMVLVLPHQLLATLACLFAVIGWISNRRWAALVAGILYSVALLAMVAWFYFVVVQLILCYVAYAKIPRLSRQYIIDDYHYDPREDQSTEYTPAYHQRVITETKVLHTPEDPTR